MDRDGARARCAAASTRRCSRELLDDDFLRAPPPKSHRPRALRARRGRGAASSARGAGAPLDDLVATLLAFSAEAVGARVPRASSPARASSACSSAAAARATRAFLARARASACPARAVEPFDAHGVPAGAAEAMAFALLGRNALLGLPNHLPRCTGARGARVLGEIVPGRARAQIRSFSDEAVVGGLEAAAVAARAHLARRGG